MIDRDMLIGVEIRQIRCHLIRLDNELSLWGEDNYDVTKN